MVRPVVEARSWWALALPSSLGLLSLWILFTENFHRHQNSDSVLPVLIGLEHWTPYYWGQNRFGMPVSGFSSLFESLIGPRGVFFLYYWILLVFSLLGVYLGTRWLRRDPATSSLGHGLSALLIGLLCLALPTHVFFEWVFQPFGISFGLLFSALVLSHNRRLWAQSAASLVLAIAFWINSGLIVFALPLFAFEIWNRKRYWTSTAVYFLPFAVAYVYSRIYPIKIHYGLKASALWLSSIHAGTVDLMAQFNAQPFGFYVVIAGFMAGLYVNRKDHRVWAVVLASLVSYLGFSVLDWNAFNYYRYLLPSYVGILLCALVFLERWAHRVARDIPAKHHTLLTLVLLVFSIGLVAYRFGTPSVQRTQLALNTSIGRYTPDVIASGCTHLIGPYWKVWSTVVHARISPEGKTMTGISYRAFDNRVSIEQSIQDRNTLVICAPGDHSGDDGEIQQVVRDWNLGQVIGKTRMNSIDILQLQ